MKNYASRCSLVGSSFKQTLPLKLHHGDAGVFRHDLWYLQGLPERMAKVPHLGNIMN